MRLVLAGVTFELERGVDDSVLRGEYVLEVVTALLRLVQRDLTDQYDVRGQGRHIGRQAPEMEMVHGIVHTTLELECHACDDDTH